VGIAHDSPYIVFIVNPTFYRSPTSLPLAGLGGFVWSKKASLVPASTCRH